MNERKTTFAELQMNANIMVMNGTMPSLAEVLAAVESTRAKFHPKILKVHQQENQTRRKAGK